MDSKVATNKINRFKTKSTRVVKAIREFLNYCYNRKTNEVLGRDGLSWAKISLFYTAFHTTLGLLFLFFVYIFTLTISQTAPTYFSQFSVMENAKDETTGRRSVNPGLGFRPHLEPESSLLTYSINQGRFFSKQTNIQIIYTFSFIIFHP